MVDLSQFIKTRADKANISCKTLLVTFFGDVISIHGGSIWLGSLITTLSSFGFSERLVRTSVFRLVEDDWLQVTKVGRKSYYSLTSNAIRHNDKAAKRIYSSTSFSESDDWLVVLPSFVSETKLPQFKKQLKWLGFSSISGSVFAHPSLEKKPLEETIKEMELLDSVIIFSSKTIDEVSTKVLKKLVFGKWKLNELQQDYDKFLVDYKEVFESICSDRNEPNRLESFLLRLLLIHDFRRVLLKDHELGKDMLPRNWSGKIARNMVIDIYHTLKEKSVEYIRQNIRNDDGLLAEPENDFYLRFVKDCPLSKGERTSFRTPIHYE